MGLMRFRVAPTQRITREMVQQAYLSGIDRTSWPVHTGIEGGDLVLERSASDSANLQLPWPVEGHGQITLASASLMERPEPYRLPLELARGTIVQVRDQVADWQSIGLSVPEIVLVKLASAVEQFSRAAVEQENESASARDAEDALRSALNAADLLAAAYAEQSLMVRRRNGVPLASFLGADLGTSLLDDYTSRQFLATFNAAEVPICWRDSETTESRFSWSVTDRQVEWCRAHRLKVLAGPLLLLAPRALPDWLCLFEDDFESVLDFVSTFIRTTVERYRGKVDCWVCAGQVNTAEVLGLSEQERLRLVARTVELVYALDPNTPAIVSFDQPWAEYMRQRASDFPPLHFADALVRAELGLAGLMLEINVGYHPGGTLPRHILEFNRQLDAWSALGLPLWLSLCVPNAYHDDPLARRSVKMPPGSWTSAIQQEWVAKFVPLALAKPAVRGVIWNQLGDSRPHDFPHGGLFDDRRHAKPALRTLATLRQTYLK